MEFKDIFIEGPKVIEPKVFGDQRGYFFESYRDSIFSKNGIDVSFVQDNQSLSGKGILRGLHFQKPPFAQGKLVRVISGSVLDVIVDIRKNSRTYGKHFSITLSGENKTMFWIPPGFAHGFLTLENNTLFVYKCTGIYHPEAENGLAWNDIGLNIDWNIENPTISEKDNSYTPFSNFSSPF